MRSERATHNPGKVLLDVATAVALGGDCLADVAVVRAQPEVFGPVASDPTVSRLVATLAADAADAVAAIRTARAAARARVWGRRRPVPGPHGGQVIIDLDATLVTAHSDKELAAPTFKRGFGFHPLFAFVDHGADGSGETLAGRLRTGSAGANTATDHIAVLDEVSLDALSCRHQCGSTTYVKPSQKGRPADRADGGSEPRSACLGTTPSSTPG